MRRTIPLAATAILLTIGVGAAVALAAPVTDDARDLAERSELGPDRPDTRSGMRHGDGEAPCEHGPSRDGQHGDHAAHGVSSELDFLTHMIPHHAEAVEAAEQLKQRTDRPEMREFAELIIEVQEREIVQMGGWLDEWYGDDTHDADYEPMMRDLDGLDPDEVDRVFLEDMIPHHVSAVMMSMQLLRHDLVVNEEIVPFAQQIADDQRAEIRQMRRWLAEWYGDDPMGGMHHGVAAHDGHRHRAGDGHRHGAGAPDPEGSPETHGHRRGAAQGSHTGEGRGHGMMAPGSGPGRD